MKFKNLSLVFVFIFIASLVVFSLCRQAEAPKALPETYNYVWHIPESIQARYPELGFKQNLTDNFETLMSDVYENHNGNRHGQNGQKLASYHAVFYTENDSISGPDEISDHFRSHEGRDLIVEDTVEVFCFDMERPGLVGDEAIDFVSVVRFNHSFGNGGPEEDPRGDVVLLHRKICTSGN